MGDMRRVIIMIGLAAFAVAAVTRPATANELNDWMAQQATDDFLPDERSRDDFEADEVVDPGQPMRMRMHDIADEGLSGDEKDALHPCGTERSERRRLFCWSSYGRNLRMSLPVPVSVVVGALRPRTLYSYQSIDLRFPPSVRINLPFNATTTFGYDDETLAWRLRWKF
jgi:hypothetical protein